ncbi:hypothetical protein P3T23_002744 [Paraburkholderia sp. GAS448]|uniref:hypothetical protein n=1 Tax=Paraburkholderia sp. GAS448 TaxID=3035136 RepID=UPI003D25F692
MPEKTKASQLPAKPFFDVDSGAGESATHTAVPEVNEDSENDARHINILEKIRSANRPNVTPCRDCKSSGGLPF